MARPNEPDITRKRAKKDAYFAVNGNGHPSPLISPPPAVGQFSPPSIPGTPVQPRIPEWRVPPGSDHERSPYAARAAHISIPEINHIRIREDELIKVSKPLRTTSESFAFGFLDNGLSKRLSRCYQIPGEVEITEDAKDSPQPAIPRSPRPRSRSPRARSRSPLARSRSPRTRSRSPRAPSRSPRARSRSPRARSRSPRARSRSPRTRSRSPRARSRSPRARSRSPRTRSKSPRRRSRSPRSPQRRSPQRRDDQPPGSRASPPPTIPDPLDEEPSLAGVLTLGEPSGVLEVTAEPGDDEMPTTLVGEYQVRERRKKKLDQKM
ncbi:serine/arginine repetitive matrix protein 2-like [Orbicella faveolata]|uniref:serine/arginine repetitive matrix protein 2-like n=1 Tax=Orbicella faveolata TaxID=48498 RepID=UPI0009E36BFF|nr:serine/arginine repetitive matrix protein 2-like [Orbicella faveolata]